MNHYDLVIIGGGSGGLSSAISAHEEGIKSILILEKDEYLGGILNQCIHNGFGIKIFNEELTGPEYAYNLIKMVNDRNISYKTNTMVTNITKDKVITYINNIDGLQKIKAKAIISSTGCYERTKEAINIPGTRPTGVFTAGLAQKYVNMEGYLTGKRIFILGSGDIGLIMARRMTLEGAKVLGVAEIMPYSNGLNRNIVQCLNDFNIPLYLSHTVKEIIGEEKLEKVIISKVDENLKFIEGSEFLVDCDCLLLSVGLIPSNNLLEEMGVLMDEVTKGPVVNSDLQTSVNEIFSCGNSLHVHDLVDNVTLEGRKAGISAANYIKGLLKEEQLINLHHDKLIGYLIPQKIKLNENVEVFFRVKKPLKDVYLYVKQKNEIIKKIKKPYLLPSLMESIKLNINNPEEIEIGVMYD